MKNSILYVCDVLNSTFGIAARGTIYKDKLIKAGWNVRYIAKEKYPNGWQHLDDGNVEYIATNDEIVEIAKQYQIVYFIKCVDAELVQRIKSETRCIIAYDVYDTIWNIYPNIGNSIFKNVDVFISEGRYLNKYITKYNKPIFNLNGVCIYDELLNVDKTEKSENKIVIGWLGSASTIGAVYSVMDPLSRIARKHPEIEIRIIGANIDCELFPKGQIKCVDKYDYNTMLAELEKFDIGIFPPPKDSFDYEIRGPHKGVRYMGAKVATVFFAAGDCLEFVEDGKNAMLYISEEEFEEKLTQLVEDKMLRCHIAVEGYKTVIERYSLNSSFSTLNIILKAILNMRFKRFLY